MEEGSREELAQLLDAVQAMARACAEPGFDHAVGSLLAIVARATRSDRTSMFTPDDEAGVLLLVGTHPHDARSEAFRRMPIEGTKTGAAYRAGDVATWLIDAVTFRAADARELGVQQVAAVPLRTADRVTAMLNLARGGERPYSPAELAFAERLGHLLLVYLDNARLYDDARRRLEQSRLLLDASRTLTRNLDLKRRLADSTELITRLVGASNAYVMLLDEGGTELRGVATTNESFRDEFRRVRIGLTEASIAGRAVRDRAPVAVEDAATSPLVRRDLVERLGERSLLALPLLVQGEPIGSVIVDDTRDVRRWTRAEIEHAEVVAQMAAASIDNARLYEEVQKRSAELERAQKELVRRERLAAIGQLAATLAHEVRNPLAVFFNALGGIGKVLPDRGDGRALLDIMREEAERLERLVRELLEFARPVEPMLAHEPLRAVVDGAVAAARTANPHAAAVSVSLTPADATVAVDAPMLHRALVNVLVNALQATTAAGTVTVAAAVDRTGGSRVARIEVSDTGSGVPRDALTRVFDPFFTTKATGTGLGLAIARGIVESHRGEIALTSEPGRGTTVRITFPAGTDPTGEHPAVIAPGATGAAQG